MQQPERRQGERPQALSEAWLLPSRLVVAQLQVEERARVSAAAAVPSPSPSGAMDELLTQSERQVPAIWLPAQVAARPPRLTAEPAFRSGLPD